MKLNFKKWLEATERKAPEKKGKDSAADQDDHMDIFGGEETELDIDPNILKRIYQTEPQVGAHINFDDLDWKLMPFKVKGMSSQGTDIETFDDDDVHSQTYKGGRKNKATGQRRGHIQRKQLADLVGQGWQAATAAAAGGAPGGMPGGLGI